MRVAERARAPAYLPAACRWQTLFRNQSRGVKRTPNRLKNLDRVYPPINVINVNVHRLYKNQFALGNIENPCVSFLPLSQFFWISTCREVGGNTSRFNLFAVRIGNLARVTKSRQEGRLSIDLDCLTT